MNFINNINFLPHFRRGIFDLLAEITNLLDSPIGSGVNLKHIHDSACGNPPTRITFVTRLWPRAFLTIYSLGQYFSSSGLPGTTRPAEEISMRQSLLANRIL
ncbi:hypothetical protein D3C73_953570 [compost metagenome]